MTTEEPPGAGGTQVVERFGGPARWFHAGVYLTVLILLATGWWLLAGREGDPSPLARLFMTPDTSLHTLTGWVLAGLTLGAAVIGARAVPRFLAESLRFRRTELRWFARWPSAVFTGRFAGHDGRFDPGQRILNITLTVGLAVLVISGAGLALLHGGPTFAILARIHKVATFPVTALIAGHILVASGLLPGYRGVWRSMHLGGRLDADVAHRLWPAWTARAKAAPQEGEQERERSGEQAAPPS
ncbi:MAG: cytochrome b/b6 domain-containing protein [Carbonactinosporaceae bacterium]